MSSTVVTLAVTVTGQAPVTVVTSLVSPSDLASLSGSIIGSLPTSTPSPASPTPSPSANGTSPTSSGSASNHSQASLVGAVAGGILGGFAFFTLIIVMACLSLRRSKKGRERSFTLKNGGKGFTLVPRNPFASAGANDPAMAAAAAHPARPEMYERQGPHGRSAGSSLLPLMSTRGGEATTPSSSDLRLSKLPTHSSMSLVPTGLYTPPSSYSRGNQQSYSIVSAGANPYATPGYEYFDDYSPEVGNYNDSASRPMSGASSLGGFGQETFGEPLAAAGGLHPMSRHLSAGIDGSPGSSRPNSESTLPASRPISSATVTASNSQEMSRPSPAFNGRRDGSHTSMQNLLGFVPAKKDRPSTAGSTGTARPLSSAGEPTAKHLYTAAASYASPEGPLLASVAPIERTIPQQAQRPPIATRPPVAGLPGRTSTLSTIPGSISERSATERADSIRESVMSGRVDASSVPRLPSIPASSPLIIQGAMTASTINFIHRSINSTGTFASSTGTSTLDSNGTINTFTGTRKGDLHVVGTLSTQSSSLPPIVDEERPVDHVDKETQEERRMARGRERERNWSIDSQGTEFWKTKEPESSEKEVERSTAPKSITGDNTLVDGHQRSSSGMASTGSRLIEMLGTSDSSDEGFIPSDPFASQSALSHDKQQASTEVERNAIAKTQSRSSHSLAQLFRSSPKGKHESLAPEVDEHRASSPTKQKKVSTSPLNAFGIRLNRQAASPGHEAKLTPSPLRTPKTAGVSLDELPPLDLGGSLTDTRSREGPSSIQLNRPPSHASGRGLSVVTPEPTSAPAQPPGTHSQATPASSSENSGFIKLFGRRGDGEEKKGVKANEVDVDTLFS